MADFTLQWSSETKEWMLPFSRHEAVERERNSLQVEYNIQRKRNNELQEQLDKTKKVLETALQKLVKLGDDI